MLFFFLLILLVLFFALVRRAVLPRRPTYDNLHAVDVWAVSSIGPMDSSCIQQKNCSHFILKCFALFHINLNGITGWSTGKLVACGSHSEFYLIKLDGTKTKNVCIKNMEKKNILFFVKCVIAVVVVNIIMGKNLSK